MAAGGAFILARRRAPGRRALAVDFDRRLSGSERLSAALECVEQRMTGPLAALVCAQGLELLHQAEGRHLPRPLRRRHWGLVWGLCLVLGSFFLPETHTTVPIVLPGTRLLRWQHLGELSPLLELGDPPALTEPERRRTSELVARARAFQQQMIAGLPPEQVGRELNQLQDSLREELEALRAPSEQAGLRAAVAALREEPVTATAADLLEDNDLMRFDREIRRLSSAEERAARLRAQSSLNRAASKAQSNQANATSRVLGEQADLFEARAGAAERIRELITQLGSASPSEPPTAARAPLHAESGPRRGGAEPSTAGAAASARQLAAALNHAATGGDQDFTAPALAELEQLTRVTSKDVAQELTQVLQRFGAPAPSAERHQVMWETSRAVSRLQSALGGNAPQLQDAHAEGWGGQNQEQPGPRGATTPNSPGKAAPHEGETPVLGAMGLRARTEPPVSRGLFRSSFGQSFSESPLGSSGRVGRLNVAEGPTELQGVERPTIPSEYREQVSRYFSAE